MVKRKVKKGTPMQFRQGDVFFIETSKPTSAKKQEVPKDRLVLEYGEVTGHAHAINEPETVDLYLEGTKRFLEMCYEKPVAVQHEEHDTITLPKDKVFEVRRQQTWSVLEQMSKVVID